MEKQTSWKRLLQSKLFMGILGLLLISLGVNIYFGVDQWQEHRQDKIAWGKQLILAYYDANMHAGLTRGAIEELLDHDTIEQRLIYKHQIGMASKYTHGLPNVIQGAQQVSGRTFEPLQASPLAYFIFEINNVLGSIVNHTEPLTEDELTYLHSALDLFAYAEAWLKTVEIENTADELALRMVQGGPWIEAVEEINRLFVDAPEYLFTYRADHE